MITPILQEAVASAAPAFTKPIEPGAKAIYSRDGSKVITVPKISKSSSSSSRRKSTSDNEDDYSDDFDPDDIQYVAGDNIDFEYGTKNGNAEASSSVGSSSKKKKKKKKKSKNASTITNDPDSNSNSVEVHEDGNGITINNIDFSSPQSIVSAATAAAEVVGGGNTNSSTIVSTTNQQYSSKKPLSSKKQSKDDRIWDTSSEEERERIKEFWLSLSEDERRDLVKIEKDTVLQIMKDQQRNSCSCSVCGRKRVAIEEELEALYDAYYAELEMYSEKGVPYSFGKGLPVNGPYDNYDHSHGHVHGHVHKHADGHDYIHSHDHHGHHNHSHSHPSYKHHNHSHIHDCHDHSHDHSHDHNHNHANTLSHSNSHVHSRKTPDRRSLPAPNSQTDTLHTHSHSQSDEDYDDEDYQSDEIYDEEDYLKMDYLKMDYQDKQDHAIHLIEHHREELEAAGVDFSVKTHSRADYELFQSILKGREKHNMDGGPCNTKIWPPPKDDELEEEIQTIPRDLECVDDTSTSASASATSIVNTDITPETSVTSSQLPDTDLYNFGSSLTIQGGILTVADDLIKNNGKRFIDMMEQLAGRRMAREEETLAAANEYEHNDNIVEDDGDEYLDDGEEDDVEYIDDYDDDIDDDYDDEEYDDDEEDPPVSEEQRMAEGRRMLQIFAARMFEQRVLNAYREKVAQERQKRLLEELEEESRLQEEKELKKLKDKEKKKDKKRQQKLAKEEEKAKKEAEKAQAKAALIAEQAKKQEIARQKKLEQKRLQEEERKKKLEEERKREAEKERKRKEREEKENQRRREKEAKEAEARRLRAEEEELINKAKKEEDEKKRKAKEDEEEHKRKVKEAQEAEVRRLKEAQEAANKAELSAKQQHQKQLLASLQQHQQQLSQSDNVSSSSNSSSSASPQSSLSIPLASPTSTPPVSATPQTPIALPTLPHSMTQPLANTATIPLQTVSHYGQLSYQQQQQPQQQPQQQNVPVWNPYLPVSGQPPQQGIIQPGMVISQQQPPAPSNIQPHLGLMGVLGYGSSSGLTSPPSMTAQPHQHQTLQQAQQPPIKRPNGNTTANQQDYDLENPVDELNRIIGGHSLLGDDEDAASNPTINNNSPTTLPVPPNSTATSNTATSNTFGSGRLFSSSLFDSKTSSPSPDWSAFGRRTSSLGNSMWSTSATSNANSMNNPSSWNSLLPQTSHQQTQQSSQQPPHPQHINSLISSQPPAPAPPSSTHHYPSSFETIRHSAISAYQKLLNDGWTGGDGYVPAQVLYHSTLKLLGGSLTFNQNEFHHACGVYDDSTNTSDRFDSMRDNVGLVTHLKYNPTPASVSRNSIVSPTMSAPGLQMDATPTTANNGSTNNSTSSSTYWPVRLAGVF